MRLTCGLQRPLEDNRWLVINHSSEVHNLRPSQNMQFISELRSPQCTSVCQTLANRLHPSS